MLRLRSIFVGRLGHFCSVGQRACRSTTLTAGDKRARLSGISCTTGPVCGTVGQPEDTGLVVGSAGWLRLARLLSWLTLASMGIESGVAIAAAVIAGSGRSVRAQAR